jgi:hypothetical protein
MTTPDAAQIELTQLLATLRRERRQQSGIDMFHPAR